jgi:hypothetical protein
MQTLVAIKDEFDTQNLPYLSLVSVGDYISDFHSDVSGLIPEQGSILKYIT